MLLKKSIRQAKLFLNKSFQSLKSFLFGECQRLPKIFILNPISCSTPNPHSDHQPNHIVYREFPNRWNSDWQDQAAENVIKKSMMMSRELMIEDANYSSPGGSMDTSDGIRPKKKHGEDQQNLQTDVATNGGRSWYVLAQKMKELEMMDAGDVDQTLDVEEALHYYSRLNSPVYLDIVDKFFTDMYREFFISQPPIGVNSSISGRLSPLVL